MRGRAVRATALVEDLAAMSGIRDDASIRGESIDGAYPFLSNNISGDRRVTSGAVDIDPSTGPFRTDSRRPSLLTASLYVHAFGD
jgi:hypothetical protein